MPGHLSPLRHQRDGLTLAPGAVDGEAVVDAPGAPIRALQPRVRHAA